MSCLPRSLRSMLLFALVLALGAGGGVAAQSVATGADPVVPASGPGFTTLAAFTLPPSFYVGDRAELRIRLKLAVGESIRAPVQMPTDRWVKIDSIAITHTSDYTVVHIFFASFAPGLRSLPPINLGAITLRGIKVTTASLVAEGNTRLTDPKGQLALPGTTLILGLFVALLIGLPLGFVLAYRKLRYSLNDFLEKRRARRPWRQLRRVLDALAGQQLDPRSFYITLGDELRRYLSLKLDRDFRAVTAREFVPAAQQAFLGEEAALGLATVLSFGELVKFAGAPAGEEVLRRDLLRVREIVEGLEESSERSIRAGAAKG